MEPGDIEFVSDGTGAVMPPPPRPRFWQVLLVVAVAAAGIGWAVTRHSGGQPVAASTSTHISLPPIRNIPELTINCDPASGCHMSQADIAAIRAAVAAQLPNARLSEVSTTVRPNHGTGIGLAERILDAHIDSVDLLLRIRPYLHPEPAPTAGITPTPPGLGSAFFRFTTAAFVVDVQWTGTDSTPPPVDKLQALADDPRLESLS